MLDTYDTIEVPQKLTGGYTLGWFDTDKKGLGELQSARPKSYIAWEMFQNGIDAGASTISMTMEPTFETRGRVHFIVEDNAPGGFEDIKDAFTLFARSKKRKDPTKRGRFNLGEKLVLAICDEAKIVSQNAAVAFLPDNTRKAIRERTEIGTRFEAIAKVTKAELEEVKHDVAMLLSPAGVDCFFNGVLIPYRQPDRVVEANLETEFDDEDGNPRKTRRNTTVEIVPLQDGETAYVYEMGIPVVETDMPFHVNVMQKVPLTYSRDNLKPAYMRELAAVVLNATHDMIVPEEAAQTWVNEAMGDKSISKEAVEQVVKQRFGDKVVTYNPRDLEANNKAVLNDYRVMPTNAFSKEAMNNIRRFDTVKASSQLFPTYRPYSDDPDAKPVDVVPESQYTEGMRQVVALTRTLGKRVLGRNVLAIIVRHPDVGLQAAYVKDHLGRVCIHLNLNGIGTYRFNAWSANLKFFIGIIGHELAHDQEGNHLTESFHTAMEGVFAVIVEIALTDPALFSDPAKLHSARVDEKYMPVLAGTLTN